MKSKSGSILIIFLFMGVAMALLMSGFSRVSRLHLVGKKTNLALRCVLMSVARTHADSLEKLALEEQKIAPLIASVSDTGAVVARVQWSSLLKTSQSLPSLISGYKGRMSSVKTVAAQLNGLEPNRISITSSLAPLLGLLPMGQWMEDERGQKMWVDSFWVRRVWSHNPGKNLRLPVLAARYAASSSKGQNNLFEKKAQVIWDGAAHHSGPITGGYPHSWADFIQDFPRNIYQKSFYSARSLDEWQL